MISAWVVSFVCMMVCCWFVQTWIWMHAFDDAGEPWWAAYVPIYSLVCCLRTVDASPHWAWLIVPSVPLALVMYDTMAPAGSAVEQARAAVILMLAVVLSVPVWLNARLYKKVVG